MATTTEITFVPKEFEITHPVRAFKIVIRNASPQFGVHLETKAGTMRANLIGFRSDGYFEMSSLLGCNVKLFILSFRNLSVHPSDTVVEGFADVQIGPVNHGPDTP